MQNQIVRNSSLLTILVLALASLFPLITANRYPAYLSDDAYITLTYAKNLANGRGFVFNHPPSVLGTTTPLLTMMVAGLATIAPQTAIPRLAVYLTAFCWLGIVWVFFRFRKEWSLKDWQAGIVGLVIIASGWISYLGMEVYPFAFLLVLSQSLFLSRHYVSTGFCVGLLFLTRGEGILVLAVILIAMPVRQWHRRERIDVGFVRSILSVITGFAIPTLLWILYASFTFGSFLPNTLGAKQAQAQNGLWHTLMQRLMNEWVPLWGKPFTIEMIPIINPWWAIVLIGAMTTLIRKRQWLLFAAWILFYISGYVLLNVSAYGWYQLPILFVLQLFFGLGIVKLVEILASRIRSIGLSLSLSALLVILLVFLQSKPTIDAMWNNRGDGRGESYIALSHWFRDNAKDSESIAYIEIGYLGYYTQNRIIDLAGLTLPDIVPHVAKQDFAWGFWHYQPDYFVDLPDFDWAMASIKADARFRERYQASATFRGPREASFVIYKRMRP